LAASPDGLVGCDGIVEVKCPWNVKDLTVLDAVKARKIKYAEKKKDGLHVKMDHNYSYQIQGQLHITQRDFCLFVVYTKRGIFVEKIERDRKFWKEKILPKLEKFFFQYFLPEKIDPRHRHNLRKSPVLF
jgi:hypothetical protein